MFLFLIKASNFHLPLSDCRFSARTLTSLLSPEKFQIKWARQGGKENKQKKKLLSKRKWAGCHLQVLLEWDLSLGIAQYSRPAARDRNVDKCVCWLNSSSSEELLQSSWLHSLFSLKGIYRQCTHLLRLSSISPLLMKSAQMQVLNKLFNNNKSTILGKNLSWDWYSFIPHRSDQ